MGSGYTPRTDRRGRVHPPTLDANPDVPPGDASSREPAPERPTWSRRRTRAAPSSSAGAPCTLQPALRPAMQRALQCAMQRALQRALQSALQRAPAARPCDPTEAVLRRGHFRPPAEPRTLPYSHLTPTLLLPYSYLTPTLLPPYSYLTPTSLLPYSHLTPTLLPPHSYLTPTLLLPYSHLTPTLLPLPHSHLIPISPTSTSPHLAPPHLTYIILASLPSSLPGGPRSAPPSWSGSPSSRSPSSRSPSSRSPS